MFQLSYGAVRRRAGQAWLVLLLAGLVAAAAAAGPWYGLAVGTRAAGAEIAAAPSAQKVLSAQVATGTDGDPRAALDAFRQQVDGLLKLPGGHPLLGLEQDAAYTDTRPASGSASSGMPLAYRDGFCAQVHLDGACPAVAGDIAVSADAAHRLGFKLGQRLVAEPAGGTTLVKLRITAIYQVPDPSGEYWTDPLFESRGQLDPSFTVLDTFRSPALSQQPALAYDLAVPLPLLRGDDLYDLNKVLNAAQPRFAAAQLGWSNPVGALVDRVRARRTTVLVAVLTALGQVVVLGWFALALAGRFTGRERRTDAGLLKLRGSSRGGLLRLSAGQHILPLAGAALAGLPVGFGAGWLVGHRFPTRSEWPVAAALSVAAVLAVLVGAFLALVAADALVQRAPVADLLRRVPTAHRDWRSAIVDVAFVALAAGAVYQARTGGPHSGLGAVAPGLVALAVGLLLARVLRWAADRAGGAAVRAGQLRAGLTAVQISRQPGTDRAFALITVAVALLAVTFGGLAAGRAERATRAQIQLGAARVLTVTSASSTALEYGVRKADPTGRYAMAAIVDTSASPAVLAVDTPRLASVATWRPEYGSITALTGGRASGKGTAGDVAPLITGTSLTVRVHSDRAGLSLLGLVVQQEATGDTTEPEFIGIHQGDQTVTTAVKGCATPPGCRLVNWDLFLTAGPDGEPVPGAITVSSLTQHGPDATVLDAAQLGDIRRWRTDITGLGLSISTSAAGLSLAANTGQGDSSGTAAYADDTTLPVPVVLAGPAPDAWLFDDASTNRFGGRVIPVRVAGTAPVLPVIGRTGLLADLDSVRRAATGASLGGTQQVWLSAHAPAAIVDTLKANGISVLNDTRASTLIDGWAADASVITAPFELFTAVLALLLAAAMLAVVVAVERQDQAAQLRALRVQGLPRGIAVATAYTGTAALVLAGLIGGLVAALIARPVAAVVAPPFPDGWRLVPPPGALGPAALGIAAVLGAIVLAVVGWLSVRPLVHALRTDPAFRPTSGVTHLRGARDGSER